MRMYDAIVVEIRLFIIPPPNKFLTTNRSISIPTINPTIVNLVLTLILPFNTFQDAEKIFLEYLDGWYLCL